MIEKKCQRIIILLILLVLSISVEAQQRNIKNLKSKNLVKKISDWRNAFPEIPNYHRVIQKAHINSAGKLYFQQVIYQDLQTKSDIFDITLNRFPNIAPELSTSEWIQPLKLGSYQAYKILPTCGLDFHQYTLEIFPDELTNISLGLKLGNKIDLIEIAENIDFSEILKIMKQKKNIY